MIALLDNTVLTNFSLSSRPDLLQEVFGDQVATVREVYNEYQAGVLQGSIPQCNYQWLSILDLNDEEHQLYEELRSVLDSGEAACIAMALSRKYKVLTDDRSARKIAMRRGCAISGTLGILLELVNLKSLTFEQADILLDQMIEAGYRSPISSLSELI